MEINDVVLVPCNIVNNNYQQNSSVLYTFIPNKSFGELLDILLKNSIFLKTKVLKKQLTDQNSDFLEIED